MRVLFADDDPEARALVSAVLTELGHDLVTAADGEHAWQLFEQEPPPLVVLDLSAESIGAIELCRRIRAHAAGPETFILVVTTHEGRDHIFAVLEAGADDYLIRPASAENLRARFEIANRRIAQDNARRATEAELARARWLSGIGETTIAIEHEINNPLSSLLGHAELLLMEHTMTPAHEEQVAVIHEQALRIKEVVRSLARLKNPQSVEYLGGALMIDLSARPARGE